MTPFRPPHHPRTLFLATLATGALATVAGPLSPAQGSEPGSGPDASAAQTGCVLKSISLRSIHVDSNQTPEAGPRDPGVNSFMKGRRSGDLVSASAINRVMIFKVQMTCTSGTSWKTTMQIRKRRTGPDKNVAYKQFKGRGSHTFIVGADCKSGQAFNGNFRINFTGAETSADRAVKNKKCT